MKYPGIMREAHAHAITLVRTAIAAEHNLGRLISFAEEGVEIIEWIAVVDAETTDECLGLDGLRWYLPPDPMDYAGYVGIGHDVPFPGPVGPHIWNCRSTVVPVDENGTMLEPAAMLAMDV